MNTQGTVTEVTVRQGVSKAGKPYTLYGLAIDGAKFGLDKPFDAPLCKQGDVIQFFAGKNNAGYDTASSVVVVGQGEVPPVGVAAANVVPATPTAVAQAAPPAPVRVDTRDISIVHQSSRKDALVMMGMMFEQEAIAFPKSAKASDKYDTMLALLEELTNTFHLRIDAVRDAGGVRVEDVLDEEVG